MSTEERWPFVHTGPGTPAGRCLRSHWQPVYESARLAPGQVVGIELLGERFTLFRGASGQAQLVGARCSHRGTLLSTGQVVGETLSCGYHGWRFDGQGRCVDQPAEPVPFCDKAGIAAHPVQEQLGLVFAWLGEGTAPPLPRWPEFEAGSVSSIALLPCNYFQSAENIVDDVHVAFTHRSLGELSASSRGNTHPRVDAAETPFGMSVSFTAGGRTERNHWLMPNVCCVGYDLRFPRPGKADLCFRARTLFWYVPVDDRSHLHVMVTVPGSTLLARQMRAELAEDHSVAQQIADVLAGRSQAHRDGTRLPNLVRTQDGVAIVGQGEIADRDAEHLGASDAGIVLLRRLWRRELKRLDAGAAPTPFCRPDDLLGLLA